jgi:DNA-binding response OmpR family regulator
MGFLADVSPSGLPPQSRPMSKKPIKVLLLVEDNQGDARLLREMLNERSLNGTEVSHVTTMSDAESHLGRQAVDIIVLDLGLPDTHGLEAIRRTHAAAPRIPLVVLTGLDDESLAAQALQEGAQDYLLKGQIDTRGLHRSLRYAMERKVMEEALFAEKERAQVTLSCIGDAVDQHRVYGNHCGVGHSANPGRAPAAQLHPHPA